MRCREAHVTLRKMQAELAALGVVVSYSAIWKFVHEMDIGFKKSLYAEEVTRPDVARKRRWWQKVQARIAATRLVFIPSRHLLRNCLSGNG